MTWKQTVKRIFPPCLIGWGIPAFFTFVTGQVGVVHVLASTVGFLIFLCLVAWVITWYDNRHKTDVLLVAPSRGDADSEETVEDFIEEIKKDRYR